jgi:excisionase family DNA binding protein
MSTAMAEVGTHEKLFSVDATAERLNLSHWTVRSWCRSGRLEHYKLGSKIFIAASEINRVIDQSKVHR